MKTNGIFTLLLVAVAMAMPAFAAKEKFVRNKPHVNVGTVRLNDESLTVSVGLVSVEDQITRGSSASDACGGMFDIRVVDADDPAGTPFSEAMGRQIGANERTVLAYTGGSTQQDVYVVVVARDMDNIKAKGCVVRGRVDVVNNTDGATRSIELRPEDFVKMKDF